MKIKITGKVEGLETGLIYDVPDKQAKKLIKEDVAIQSKTEKLVDVTALSDEHDVYIEGEA